MALNSGHRHSVAGLHAVGASSTTNWTTFLGRRQSLAGQKTPTRRQSVASTPSARSSGNTSNRPSANKLDKDCDEADSIAGRLAALRCKLVEEQEKTCTILQAQEEAVRRLEQQLLRTQGDVVSTSDLFHKTGSDNVARVSSTRRKWLSKIACGQEDEEDDIEEDLLEPPPSISLKCWNDEERQISNSFVGKSENDIGDGVSEPSESDTQDNAVETITVTAIEPLQIPTSEPSRPVNPEEGRPLDPILAANARSPGPQADDTCLIHVVPMPPSLGTHIPDARISSFQLGATQSPGRFSKLSSSSVPREFNRKMLSTIRQSKRSIRASNMSEIVKVRASSKPKADNESSSRRTSVMSEAGNRKRLFADISTLKDQVRDAIAQPEYDVALLYKEGSVFTKIATSRILEQGKLVVIALNTLWLAINVDSNDEPLLIHAGAGILLVELFLCALFMFEWVVRLMAFDDKTLGLQDQWFLFDTIMCAITVIDVVLLQFLIFPFVVPDSGSVAAASSLESTGNVHLLKVVWFIRLIRIVRMVYVYQAFPELMMLAKGIALAVRSMFFTLVLLGSSVYAFALIFRQATDKTRIGDKYFRSVTDAMATLTLRCTVPDVHSFLVDVASEHVLLAVVLSAFILLATFTVMNMLVGVLVEVVKVVSAVEQESLHVMRVQTTLFSMLEKAGVDKDFNGSLSKVEFETLVCQPAAVRIISSLGVDVMGLVDFAEHIFADDLELSFAEFMSLVLELRGTNTATVKDIVEMRKCFMQELDDLKEYFGMHDGPILDSVRSTRLGSVLEHVSSGPSAGICLPTSQAR